MPLGRKWRVSRNWVSLPVETPLGEGLLLWTDDSGTPREQLVISFYPRGLTLSPSQSHRLWDTPHPLPPS